MKAADRIQAKGFAFCVILWMLVMVSGCIPALHEIKTPLAVPEQFSESGGSPLPDKWWMSLEDPVLNTLIDQALESNFSLKAAWDRLHQAEALARKQGAGLFPTLDAEADFSRTRSRTDSRTSSTHGYGLDLAAGYELDMWGRIRSGRDAAVFDARASAEDLWAAAITLSAQVASTWYRIVEQNGQLDVLNEQIATNENVLELVTLQFRTGQVGIADMLQQRQLVESKQGEKVQIEARVKILEHQLAILLGLPPNQSVAPKISRLIDLPSLPKTGLPAEWLQHRPDIRGAFFSVKAADSELAAAIADRFPRLSLSARLDTSGDHTRDLFDNWLATLAANLVGPIIDGGLRKAEVERTHAAASEALHTYGQTLLDGLGEVEDALIQEAHRRDFIASLDQQLKLAGQVVERVRDRYLQGTVDYQRVLDALLSQQTLQSSLLSAQLNRVLDRIDLCRALGGGWNLNEDGYQKKIADKN